MPIYEFYCEDCNTIFNFFSSRINTEKRPMCPKCNSGPIVRLMSRFAFVKGAKEDDAMKMPDLDEEKLSKAMHLLEREAKNINEEDPKQAAQITRKLFDIAGLNLGAGVEEVLKRVEAGEDPDRIDEEMGDMLNEEEIFNTPSKSRQTVKKRPPERDETLYYL
ncbi:MAG: zinc ribbon domain-containing protein [Nitrospirae bacterium]|jgi:putative FmdB family regulatory protein|nr:zinc ribbon domain-containing protein [Nitrospirota bacterium]